MTLLNMCEEKLLNHRDPHVKIRQLLYCKQTNPFQVDNKLRVVRNTLRLPNVSRRDHGTRLTCRASNTDLAGPVATSVKINMVCKYRTKENDRAEQFCSGFLGW